MEDLLCSPSFEKDLSTRDIYERFITASTLRYRSTLIFHRRRIMWRVSTTKFLVHFAILCNTFSIYGGTVSSRASHFHDDDDGGDDDVSYRRCWHACWTDKRRHRWQPIPSHRVRCCYRGSSLGILVHPGFPCDEAADDWPCDRQSRAGFPRLDGSIGSDLLDSPKNCCRNWLQYCNLATHGDDSVYWFFRGFYVKTIEYINSILNFVLSYSYRWF